MFITLPFNDYREFVLTKESDLKKLIKERKIKAIATADSKLDEKSLAEYAKFDKAHGLVVLRPLLLYPDSLKKGLLKKFK